MGESSKVDVGDVLAGKYRVERVLGAGGMGQVLRAVHVDIDRAVAVKLLHGIASDDAISRFKREARAAAKLDGEFVCKTFDFGTTGDGDPFLVMEYLEGQSLDAFAAKKALSVERAVDFVIQAAAGLAEAHLAGIVHRDVKPANLFVCRRTDGSYGIKVVDFGISKLAQGSASITHSSHALGTPLYMSPEQIRSSKNVDGRADVWSLGVVLYELLSGKLPFEGEEVNGVLAAILETTPTPLGELRPSLPAGLVAVVMRCLQKNPALRVGSMRELARELGPYGSAEGKLLGEKVSRMGTPTSVPPPSADGRISELAATQEAVAVARAPRASQTATDMSVRTPPAGGRNTRTWLLVAGGALAVGIGAALWLGGRGAPTAPVTGLVGTVGTATGAAGASSAPQISPAPSEASAPPARPADTGSAAAPPTATASASAPAPRPSAAAKVARPRPAATADPSLF